MRRGSAILALAASAALLAGCVYDPYTGTVQPCCGPYGYGYGYGYGYRYPPNGYQGPYGGPGGYQQPGAYPGQPGAYPGQAGAYPGQPDAYQYQQGAYQGPQGAPPSAAQADPLGSDFAAANVRRDGRLTRQQATQRMPWVAENFDVIDLDRKGYVTLPEVRTFVERQRGAGGQVGPTGTN
jgi:hypothetical protein